VDNAPADPTTAYVTLQNTGLMASLSVGTPQATNGSATYVTGHTPLTVAGSGAASGVASVAYCVYPQGGSCSGSFTTVPGSSTTITLGTTLADGAYTVAYEATDNLGNTTAVHTTTVTLDDTAPKVTLTIGQPQVMVNGALEVTSQTPLTLNATDAGSGVASFSYRFYPKGSTAPAFTVVSGSASATFHLTGTDGAYEVDYDATDLVGNDPPLTAYVTLANATLVQGADVAGSPSGPGSAGAVMPGGTAQPQAQANVASQQQNASGDAAAASHTSPQQIAANVSVWVPLGAVLLLMGLGGLGALLYRARRMAIRQ
jgi:Bacterial Ig-like domain